MFGCFFSRYELGKVLGAGSFGIVREAVGKRTGTHYACKTIPKIPKRGKGTPRYLLKLQTEVDAMQQLGPSLDAVYLKVSWKGQHNLPSLFLKTNVTLTLPAAADVLD